MAALVLHASVACADDPSSAHGTDRGAARWAFDPAIDLSVLAIELAVGFGWSLGAQLAPPYCAPLCDEQDVWTFDRFAAGNWDPGWRTVGDVSVAGIYAGMAAVFLLDEDLVTAVRDILIVAEAAAGAVALSILTNMSTRRPRPYVYGTAAPEDDRENGTASFSFFSGHTAGVFAASIATYEALTLHHPESDAPIVVLAVGLALSSLVGVSRILAGEHFPTDVLAGAAVGTAVGFLVPALHGLETRVAPVASATEIGVAARGAF